MKFAQLETEQTNPASRHLDRMTALEMVSLINAEDRHVVDAVAREAANIARAVDLVADRLSRGGRLIYVGAGTSGRLGVLDAAECQPTFGLEEGRVIGVIAGGSRAVLSPVEGAEDDARQGALDVAALALNPHDIVVGLAASGVTPYVIGAVGHARSVGAATLGVCCTSGSPLSAAVDLCITPMVGPEVLTGSTRMKAGTAQKMVLNMLSTCSMVKLGKVYGHWMVDVKVSNEKLAARAISILTQITGADADRAANLLRQSGGQVKVALVCLLANIDPQPARDRLEQAAGRVSDSIHGVT